MTRRGAAAVLQTLLLPLSPFLPLIAQDLGPTTGGLVALDQALRFLGNYKRVLLIAAHPDDEDTELLTVLVRGMGAEAAYLSLTRGEGGQNLIGDELGDALGVLRSEELLAARRLDGASQFFTRAWDFGYSKGLPDTWRHWPRDSVLKDVVRIVRRFRPQVIVSTFSGTPRDGHGQHQAAGWVAREAFRTAGDPSVFPELAREELLHPWTPAKLYQSARFGPEDPTVTLDGGVLDRAVGQSFLQIAMRGRSLHRSQDMGVGQPIGPSKVRLRLLEDRTGAGEGGVFAGLDTTLAGLVPRDGAATRGRLAAVGHQLRRLRPWTLEPLAGLRREFSALVGEGTGDLGPAVSDQLRRMDEALFVAADVLCDAVGSTEQLVPGRPVDLRLSCWNASTEVRVVTGRVTLLDREVGGFGPHRLAPGALRTDSLRLLVPADVQPTTPYYLERPKLDHPALYRWPDKGPRGEAFEPAPVTVRLGLESGGAVTREVVYRYTDQALGEIRRPLRVVPAVTVSVVPASGLWPIGERGGVGGGGGGEAATSRGFDVTVRLMAPDSVALTVGLEAPPEWEVEPAVSVALTAERPERSIRFLVRPPVAAPEARHRIRGVASDAAGRRYSTHVVLIEYPHTRPRQVAREAVADVSLAHLVLPRGRGIAYVRGAADRVPEVLQSMGIAPVLLGSDSLVRGELTRFGTIVIGPRAYETEAALAQASERLVDFARRGGTVLVQYQQQVFFRGGFAPFPLALIGPVEPGRAPLRLGAPRVAEEDAAVRVLDPGHSVFRVPNELGDADWDGWVQERGLYFARTWDDAWTPLLELADAGEPPQRGGLLVAQVGRGYFVYTGLSFFRELPAGIPGAARLFVNLVALGPGDAGR